MSNPVRPTYLVTGATSGIGEAIATRLAGDGAHVLIGARTVASGHAAAARLRSRAPDARLDVVTADLSEMAQVRSLAGQVRQHTARLDGLILNAAEVRSRRELTSEGFEVTFATNHLSGFLLAHLLLPSLMDAAPARIVALTSSNHAHVKRLDLDALETGHVQSYSTTKLLNILFVTEFARRAGKNVVTANAADPGFVRTNLGRHATGAFGLFLKATRPFQDAPEKAAATALHLATSPEVASTSGGYFAKSRPGKPSGLSQDPVIAGRLWDLSAKLLIHKGLAAPDELM
ncbi:SDR family NAD(P)-dependent oxidoreductase [Nonomuraea sp. CA-143628]|uniref:SDR family NAD(P)-dependent oxidoreductase n=1 Tax=Nonomuraea sp. CA-143628 TaxID=3239997 RepID=UPI003D8D3FA7